jgi:hypothetical protein
MNRFLGVTIFCLLASACFAAEPPVAAPAKPARKTEKPVDFNAMKPDPLLGDWQGQGGMVAQVFVTPTGDVQANLLKAFDTENNNVAVLHGTRSDGKITFTGDGWTGTLDQSHFVGKKGSESFDLQHVVRASPTLEAAAPKDAIVLFDGRNFDAWAKKAGKDWLAEDGPSKWKIVDGAMEVVPGTDCIITHQKFGDCHLHVEFRTLGTPTNSGVFIQDRYEANINETYGRLDGTPNGGLDNCSNVKPKLRPSFPPLAWQTFDIDFTAPRFDAAGKKTAAARATVLLNGVKIYDNQELQPPTGAAGRLGEAPTGPIMLQEHGMPLQFRNIWVVETKN